MQQLAHLARNAYPLGSPRLAEGEKRGQQLRATQNDLVEPILPRCELTFLFQNLPPELQLALLSYCTHSMRT